MKNMFEYTDRLNQPMEAFLHIPAPGNFPILPHWHYFIEILYIKEGSVEATCDDAVYTLHPGDLIIFCPQKLHSVDLLYDTNAPSGYNFNKTASQCHVFAKPGRPLPNPAHNAIYPVSATMPQIEEPICYDVLKFDLNFLYANNRFKAQFSKTLAYAFEKQAENIFFSADMLKDFPASSLMADCIQEIERQEYGYDVAVSSLISSLLTFFMRSWLKRDIKPEGKKQDSASGSQAFEEITQYIENHYNESLQVQDLAAHCNMSYSYFARLFRSTYNQSCKEYIEFIRIHKALDLLRFTDLDLTYISQETGFADCSHLIRTFKKYIGTTPKQWRKENLNFF